ncbi:hypothetical protein LXL04_002575 [Taraxacum kok-saghyz]
MVKYEDVENTCGGVSTGWRCPGGWQKNESVASGETAIAKGEMTTMMTVVGETKEAQFVSQDKSRMIPPWLYRTSDCEIIKILSRNTSNKPKMAKPNKCDFFSCQKEPNIASNSWHALCYPYMSMHQNPKTKNREMANAYYYNNNKGTPYLSSTSFFKSASWVKTGQLRELSVKRVMEHLIIIHTQPRAINHLSVPRRGGQPNSAIIVHNVPQEYGHSHGD